MNENNILKEIQFDTDFQTIRSVINDSVNELEKKKSKLEIEQDFGFEDNRIEIEKFNFALEQINELEKRIALYGRNPFGVFEKI